MPYDLFISYSRKDNSKKRVTQLKKKIESDYNNFSGEKLKCFFDTEEIKSMDDWRHRILQGLKDSHLFLLILSPNYLSSPHCEWEITEYLKYEYSRAVEGGIAQIYFLEIPGIDEPDFTDKSSDWFKKISHRQKLDLRPWYEEGEQALKRRDVKRKLKELNESLFENLSRLHSAEKSPGNLPAPNKRFVGRENEMKKLHEETGLGKFGVIAAVHGMGGLGKTSIAIQYAYAYSHFYPGGRWQIGCEGKSSLAGVLRELDTALDIYLTDEEKKDDKLAAERILRELEKRAVQGANAINRKKTTKKKISPATLLILDNVDKAQLIQSPEIDILTGKKWLKLLVTTRMGEEDLGYDKERQSLITIDELPQEDALKLIESYQKGRIFPHEKEREAAKEIVKLLDGFTLAVEMTAIYLRDTNYRVSCQDFLKLLKSKGGLVGAELAAKQSKTSIRHEKLISLTLAPTLEKLSEEEKLVLSYASQLPPDNIPIPWLKDLVKEKFPKLKKKAIPGIDDPWLSLINRLISLRILQIVEVHKNIPRIVRMHRLMQEEICRLNIKEKRLTEIVNYVNIRSEFLKNGGWINIKFKWEIFSINKTAIFWLNQNIYDSLLIANQTGDSLSYLGKLNDAKQLFKLAIVIAERICKPEDFREIASFYNNLANVEEELGNYLEAKRLYSFAFEIQKKEFPPDHPEISIIYNNLSQIEWCLGNFSEAKRLIKLSLEIGVKIYEPIHPELATSYNNLAVIEHELGNYLEAKRLHSLAINIQEKLYEVDHPELARSYSNLAIVEESLGNFTKSKILYKKAIEIREKVLGPDHLDLAVSYNNLATLERKLRNFSESERLYKLAINIAEKNHKREHPILLKFYSNVEKLEKEKKN